MLCRPAGPMLVYRVRYRVYHVVKSERAILKAEIRRSSTRPAQALGSRHTSNSGVLRQFVTSWMSWITRLAKLFRTSQHPNKSHRAGTVGETFSRELSSAIVVGKRSKLHRSRLEGSSTAALWLQATLPVVRRQVSR